MQTKNSHTRTDRRSLSVDALKNIVSHCTLDLISWKLLLTTCCLKGLIRYDTIQWWAGLSDFCRIRPYLSMDLVVKQLTHYMI